MSVTTQVTIHVADVNDNKPVCYPANITVTPSSKLNNSIELISLSSVCSDSDLSKANRIQYYTVHGNDVCKKCKMLKVFFLFFFPFVILINIVWLFLERLGYVLK